MSSIAARQDALGDAALAWTKRDAPSELGRYAVKHGVRHLIALGHTQIAVERMLDVPFMAAMLRSYATFVEPLRHWRAVGIEKANHGWGWKNGQNFTLFEDPRDFADLGYFRDYGKREVEYVERAIDVAVVGIFLAQSDPGDTAKQMLVFASKVHQSSLRETHFDQGSEKEQSHPRRQASAISVEGPLGALYLRMGELGHAIAFARSRIPTWFDGDAFDALSHGYIHQAEDLARTLVVAGDIEEIEEGERLFGSVYREVLRQYGAECPIVLNCMSGQATALGALKRHQAAERLWQRVVELSAASLGETDPRTLLAVSCQGAEMSRVAQPEEAARRCRDSLALLEGALGCEHLDVQAAVFNLAVAEMASGRLESAEKLLRRALRDEQDRRRGSNADWRARVLLLLAEVLEASGRYDEAMLALIQAGSRSGDVRRQVHAEVERRLAQLKRATPKVGTAFTTDSRADRVDRVDRDSVTDPSVLLQRNLFELAEAAAARLWYRRRMRRFLTVLFTLGAVLLLALEEAYGFRVMLIPAVVCVLTAVVTGYSLVGNGALIGSMFGTGRSFESGRVVDPSRLCGNTVLLVRQCARARHRLLASIGPLSSVGEDAQVLASYSIWFAVDRSVDANDWTILRLAASLREQIECAFPGASSTSGVRSRFASAMGWAEFGLACQPR
jgi:tetratricopeptide (TPR) repeat protein